MIRFRKRAAAPAPARVAILPGTWNPPTRAHMAIARHAASAADELLLLLPERLPHKPMENASFSERMEMLLRVAEPEATWSVASVPEGLYLQVAEYAIAAYPQSSLALVCGCDAAQRLLEWPYESPDTLPRLFTLAELWVFARGAVLHPPDPYAHRIRHFEFDEELQEHSATKARQALRDNQEWKHLIPEPIHQLAERIYR